MSHNSQYNPLSKTQKAALAQLARKAFNQLYENGLVYVEGDTKDKQFANWRHEQQAEACGESSLTKCVQRDYLKLRAHFYNILGETGKAFNDHMKSMRANDNVDEHDTPEERDRKIHLIRQAIFSQEKYSMGYAIAIARKKFNKPNLQGLEILTTDQLHQLLITVKERIRKGQHG